MLQRILTVVALAALLLAAACGDRTPLSPPAATDPGRAAPAAGPPGRPPEVLARLVARALSNAAFRAYLKAQLDASPYREHKLQFQAFLGAHGGRALRQIAAATGEPETGVAAEAGRAIALEIYLPVAEHRAAWTGDETILVATALTDQEPPVAFDPRGRRQLLDPDTPPATPVIALVPVETNFAPAIEPQTCIICEGDGGGGTVSPPPPPPPGLYLTKSHLVQGFESWLKGSPEIEAHILGQKGQTDSLISYQCAGEHAGGPYAFNQDGKDWTGRVLLFSQQQFENYNAAHPGQNVRVFFVEDDDTACAIKTDPERFQRIIFAVDSLYDRLTAGNDSSTTVRKYFGYARAAYNVWQTLASFFKSNDELIGNAVEDRIVGAFYPGYNWFLKTDRNITNGWINLVMY